MRPIIGITCKNASDADWCPSIVGVREGYVNGVIQAGGTPLLIAPQVNETMLRQIYELVDGILLSGGADIDPVHYGQEHHPKLGEIEPLRDATELPLARWAVAEQKPLLAVCRGMQVLNVALGGTLYQDINSQLTTTIEHDAGSAYKCWTNFDHDVALEPGSRLAELLGTDHFQANSLHHQALDRIAPGLRVTGRAPDGIIEAVEGEGDRFVLGVQCHPEELWQAVDQRWQRVFQAFVTAAAEQKA